MNLIEKYLGESKMGKLSGKIERKVEEDNLDQPILTWELMNPDTMDDRTNYVYIQDLAWKELQKMKNKGILDFYQDQFNVTIIDNMRGTKSYEARVRLKNFDPDKLKKELKRLKFKNVNKV